MNQEFDQDLSGVDSVHTLGTWTRVYVHGCLAFLVAFAVAYFVTRLLPIFDGLGNPALAVIVVLVLILVAPPLIGSIVVFGIFPLLGRKKAWRGLTAWDDRLVSELSLAKQRARIVILNWPSKDVRTLGVMTTLFPAEESGRQLASVYVPTAPQTRYGYIRIVSVDDLEFTEWTLKQWQLYQLTFGSAHPGTMFGASPDDEGD